jgi:hypothetical protein
MIIRLLMFVAMGLFGAVPPRYTLEELPAHSEFIVHGRIAASRVAWDAKHKYIWTHYDVAVIENIRGGLAAITVSEPGGSLDGVNQQFSGAVAYTAGEEVVLFLYRTPIGYLRTTGGPQGKVSAGPRLDLRRFKARVRQAAAANPYREAR